MEDRDHSTQDRRRGAVLSDDREYRYRLRRCWDVTDPIVAFVMLNPSTADETADDPTVRRCIGYAKEWGYGTLLVGNLFALRTPNPDDLTDHPRPVGPQNDAWLRRIATEADRVVAAWGANGDIMGRGEVVAKQLDSELHALDTTRDGHPVHPLYQPAGIDPEPYSGPGDSEA
jgi:hypothetical protein